MEGPKVLVVAVNYGSLDATLEMAHQFIDQPDTAGFSLVIADNTAASSSVLYQLGTEHRDITYCHFPDNPYYLGAARRVLKNLVEELGSPLPFDAVVLSNVDLSFEYEQLRRGVLEARTRTGDWRWILAPAIVEDGRRYQPNPHLLVRPNSRGRRRMLDHVVSWAVYRELYRLKRRFVENPHAGAAAFTKMYSAYGAFVVFGSGYFTAGGVLHDAPLFGEERGIAEQAARLSVPTYFQPHVRVKHRTEASTAASLVGLRQRFRWQRESDRFYETWDPAVGEGEMASWFGVNRSH